MVTAYKYEEKLNREDSEKLAEAKAKVLGDDKLFKDIDFNKKSK